MLAQVFHLLPMDQAPNRIRQLRLARALTQTALGNLIGVSKVTVQALEVGRIQLSLDYMKRIGSAFGLPPVDLLHETEQNQFLRDEEMALVRAYRAAGPLQREMIHRVAEQRAPLVFGGGAATPDGDAQDPATARLAG